MAGTADEAELDSSDWIKGREDLLVALGIRAVEEAPLVSASAA